MSVHELNDLFIFNSQKLLRKPLFKPELLLDALL